MAANRTFKFYGQGYGSTPVSIIAKINDTVVYTGPVPTIPLPEGPRPAPIPPEQVELFSIANSATLNTDFSGILPMTVEVTSGDAVLFGEITSNYYQMVNLDVYTDVETQKILDPNSTAELINSIVIPKANPPFNDTELEFLNLPSYTTEQFDEFLALLSTHGIPVYVSSGPDGYESCYNSVPANSENTIDPRSNVKIDEELQVGTELNGQIIIAKSTGLWNWFVNAGSTLSYFWNISIGFAPGDVTGGNNANYSGEYTTFIKSE
jgi:hypothetical protein